MLSQIQLCIEYAARFRAVVVVNATRSGFRDEFSRYFRTLAPEPFLILDDHYLDRLLLGNDDCIPRELCSRAYSYVSAFEEQSNYYDVFTGVKLTFAKNQNHRAKLLIHEQCGGGSRGWKVLDLLMFQPQIRDQILKRLSSLPKNYTCIHIRNSDVSTDYQTFIHLVKPYLCDKEVLVCTDSYDAQMYARSVLSDSNVFSLAQISHVDAGSPLHDRPGFTDISTNIDLLVDLMAMALSRAMILANPPLGYPSGFSTLARNLMQRPQIICNLLNHVPQQLV